MPGPRPGIAASEASIASMAQPKRELVVGALPPVLIWAAALSCGVLAALAMQIYLSHAGFDLAALWEQLFSAQGRQLRTTGPWWAIAGAAFITGGVAAAVLSRLPPPWHRFRLLRWGAGALAVMLLAGIGDSAAVPDAVGAGVNVAVRLAALAVAALMAAIGSGLAMRR
jgi:hypothetical protein